MQSLPNCAPNGGNASRLTYAVEIKPKGFLPVKLIEGRIASDLKANLAAIRDYVESEAEAQKLLKFNQSQLSDELEPDVLNVNSNAEHSEIDSQQQQGSTEDQQIELDTTSARQMEITPLDASLDEYESTSLSDSTESHIVTATPPADTEVQMNMSMEQPVGLEGELQVEVEVEAEVDNVQLIFENESIQRVVAALEKDLGCALAKIQMIGSLSRGAVSDLDATPA